MFNSAYELELQARQIMRERERLCLEAARRKQVSGGSRTSQSATQQRWTAALRVLLRRSRPQVDSVPVKATH